MTVQKSPQQSQQQLSMPISRPSALQKPRSNIKKTGLCLKIMVLLYNDWANVIPYLCTQLSMKTCHQPCNSVVYKLVSFGGVGGWFEDKQTKF